MPYIITTVAEVANFSIFHRKPSSGLPQEMKPGTAIPAPLNPVKPMTDKQLQKLSEAAAINFKKLRRLRDAIPAEYQTEKHLLYVSSNPVARKTLKLIKQAGDLQKEYNAYMAR